MQGVGLIALLLGVALMFYLWFGVGGKGSVGTALEVQKTVKPQVEQFAGRDAEGVKATDSLQIDASPKGVVVVSVVPGGAFDKMYALRSGDVIQEIGPLTKEQFQDNETAKAYLLDAYRGTQTLTVLRGVERLHLPDTRPPAAGVPTPQRTTPRGQLEGILKGPQDDVPTH